MSENENLVPAVFIKSEEPCDLTVEKSLSQKDIVFALAPLIRVEKRVHGGIEKDLCTRKWPNGLRCKKARGEIDFLNKSGYKNPYSHLLSCVCKVSMIFVSIVQQLNALILYHFYLNRETRRR